MPAPKNEPLSAPNPGLPKDAETEDRPVERRDPVVSVDNNTAHMIYLPCTDTFAKGLRLIPGHNLVPTKYMDELTAMKLEAAEVTTISGRKTKMPERYPGREGLALLQESVRIVTSSGETWGPQITIFAEARDEEEGPKPPLVLPRDDRAAKAVIDQTTSVSALERWSKAGNARGEAALHARARLEAVKAGRV